MLAINTVRYGTDDFAFSKSGLLITNTALSCVAFTTVDGFTATGNQPALTDRKVIFKVDGVWYKTTGAGAATLTAVATQTPTADSVIAEGNTVTELLAVTSVTGFVGKSVAVAVSLLAPGDATDFPTLQLAIKGHSNTDQFTKVDYSPEYLLSSLEDVTLVNLTASTTVASGGTALVEASLKQGGIWSSYVALTAAKNQKASAIKFRATYTATTIGTSSAKVNSVGILYRSNNAVVSGVTADLLTTTEDFGLSMKYARCMVKHQVLRDAEIKAYASFRNTPTVRDMLLIGTGTGLRQTINLTDTGLNHNSLRLFYGSQPVYDYDFNTELNQISCTAPADTNIFASYSCGWQDEVWTAMQKGSTQKYQNSGLVATEFTYLLPTAQTGKGVTSIKVVLEKPVGSVANLSLGVATGKSQMFVMGHAAKSDTIVVKNGVTPVATSTYSYEDSSRILTVTATAGAALNVSYDWTAESPTVVGLVAAWNE